MMMTRTRHITASITAAALALGGALGLATAAHAAPVPPTVADATIEVLVGDSVTIDLTDYATAGTGSVVACELPVQDPMLQIQWELGTCELTVTPSLPLSHTITWRAIGWTPGESTPDGDVSADATLTVIGVEPEEELPTDPTDPVEPTPAEPEPVDPELAGYTAPRLQGDAYESWYERYTALWNGGSDGDLCIDPTVGLYRPTVAEHAAYGGRATPVALTIRRTVDSIDALPVTIDVLDHPCAAAWGITTIADHSVPGVDTGWDVSADGRGVTLRAVPHAGAYGLLVQGVGPAGVQVVVRVRDVAEPQPEPTPEPTTEPTPGPEPTMEPTPDTTPEPVDVPQPPAPPAPAPAPAPAPIAIRGIETDVPLVDRAQAGATAAHVGSWALLALGIALAVGAVARRAYRAAH